MGNFQVTTKTCHITDLVGVMVLNFLNSTFMRTERVFIAYRDICLPLPAWFISQPTYVPRDRLPYSMRGLEP